MLMRLAVVAGVSSLLLAACGAPNEKICLKPQTLAFNSMVGDRSLATAQLKADNCVHRWAYKLAGASDPAGTVADAVMGACRDTLFPLVSARYEDARANGGDPDRALSDRSGEQVALGREVYDDTRAAALFHVIQARAGRCAIP